MDMVKTTKYKPRDQRGIDAQSEEFRKLSSTEQKAIKMYNGGSTYDEIRAKLYPNLSRQAVYDTIRRAERKLWRFGAQIRWAKNLGDCPVDEMPLPARIRNALRTAGYERAGQVSGMEVSELAKIGGLRRVSALVLYNLLREWKVPKAQSFCPGCGAAMRKRLNGKKVTVKCPNCGSEFDLQNVTRPKSKPQPIGAAAGD